MTQSASFWTCPNHHNRPILIAKLTGSVPNNSPCSAFSSCLSSSHIHLITHISVSLTLLHVKSVWPDIAATTLPFSFNANPFPMQTLSQLLWVSSQTSQCTSTRKTSSQQQNLKEVVNDDNDSNTSVYRHFPGPPHSVSSLLLPVNACWCHQCCQ